eukprot:jgi/Chrzof1/12190/Cz06g24160.t1
MSVGNFGNVCTWGTDADGLLGHASDRPLQRPVPRPTAVNINLMSGAMGWRHCAGISKDGRLYTWGWGGAVGSGGFYNPDADLGGGQLGHGDSMDYYAARQVQRLSFGRSGYRDLRQVYGAGAGDWRAVQVSCGRNHTAAVVEADLKDWELG